MLVDYDIIQSNLADNPPADVAGSIWSNRIIAIAQRGAKEELVVGLAVNYIRGRHGGCGAPTENRCACREPGNRAGAHEIPYVDRRTATCETVGVP